MNNEIDNIRKRLEDQLTTPEMKEMVINALIEYPEIDGNGYFEQYIRLYCTQEQRSLIEKEMKNKSKNNG